jgi:glycosyltransferase involved in cell wall biosynthesis
MWLFTGGCHYASGCTQFETACMKCPQVSDRMGLASATFEDKMAAYGGGLPGLEVVALCSWMKDLAARSRILGESPAHLIPNPIETDIFIPDSREALRANLGIGPEDAVLLFGNYDNSEARKGTDILTAALQKFAASRTVQKFAGRIHLMSFGRNVNFDIPSPLTGISMGEIKDDTLLAGLYSVADLFCFPSIEDNYPNSIVEAAACGTPSVAFQTGGMADMIKHGETGWLVQSIGDADAFATGLTAALSALHGNAAVRTACRRTVLETNGMETVGQQLATAYSEALGKPYAPRPTSADDMSNVPQVSTQILSHVLLKQDDRASSEFLKPPLRAFLRSKGAKEESTVGTPLLRHRSATSDANRLRILAVRSFHEHHSAHSGPYQFLRHLPAAEFDISNVMIPLGNDLVPDVTSRAHTEALGKLLGASPFGTQSNAWAGEWEIARRLRAEPFDLVHFIDGELNGWLVTRLPTSFFADGRRPIMLNMLHQPEHLAAEWTTATGLSRFDMLGTVAEHQAEALRNMVPGLPVSTVPHGIDTDFFCPSDNPRPLVSKGGPFRLLAVGHWLRDYDLAFAALDKLAAAGFDIEYRIVCHSLNRSDLPPYVTLLSGISDDELRHEYREADLFFMPLASATANNALLESMACGTPVVSTLTGGVPEYVSQEAGRLCAPNPENCADTLQELLTSPRLRGRMGLAARAHAKTFDWRIIAQHFSRIYQSLCNEARQSEGTLSWQGQKP